MPLLDKFFNRQGQSSPSPQRERRNANTRHEMNCNLIDEKTPSPIAIIYQNELDYISRCILDYPNIETRGLLFVFGTSTGIPVVLYVIGPRRDAQHNPTSFIQDQDYLQSAGNELHKRFRLLHIGDIF